MGCRFCWDTCPFPLPSPSPRWAAGSLVSGAGHLHDQLHLRRASRGSGLLAAGGPLPEIGVTVFVINIRYMLMSLSLSQRLEGMSLGKRLLVANGVTDEIFFLAMQKPGNRLSGWFFTGLALGPYAGWVGGTLAGALAGAVLPASLTSALGVALYAMFIAIVIPTVRDSSRVALVVALAVLLSCLFHYVPGLNAVPSGWALILAAVTASAVGAWRFPHVEPQGVPPREHACILCPRRPGYGRGDVYSPGASPVADAPPGGEPVLAVLSVLHALRRAGRHDLPCDFGGDGHPWSAAVGMAVALILAYLRLNLLPVALASTASVFVVEWAMGLYR